jgi:2-amino-4-hydroxy-6-hydroxymethyldihydropteridine diphosphokinase
VTQAFLGLGSNMGDRRRLLRDAIETLRALGEDSGIRVEAVSPVYETDPVGGPEQDRYLNLVVELDVDVSPRELLGVCHRLESAAGRVRRERWGPRTLDVDILWMEGVDLDDPDLTVPHPRMWERRFVLTPLRDLAPDLVDLPTLEASEGHVAPTAPLDQP